MSDRHLLGYDEEPLCGYPATAASRSLLVEVRIPSVRGQGPRKHLCPLCLEMLQSWLDSASLVAAPRPEEAWDEESGSIVRVKRKRQQKPKGAGA